MGDEEGRSSSGEQPVGEAQQEERIVIPLEELKQRKHEAPPSQDVRPEEPTTDEIKRIVEALLLAASEPISAARLAKLSGAREHALRRSIEELTAEYVQQKRAFSIEEVAGGYQLMTLPEFQPWISELRHSEQEHALSQAALETLAIIAYKQPITRAEIEDVRGVQSGYILRALIEKGLVRVTGRSDQLGHPLLYGTSKKFLEAFGLPSLDALPTLDELQPPTAERRESGNDQQH